MAVQSNQNVFLIQKDASSFVEFEISEFEISRVDCTFKPAQSLLKSKRGSLHTGSVCWLQSETPAPGRERCPGTLYPSSEWSSLLGDTVSRACPRRSPGSLSAGMLLCTALASHRSHQEPVHVMNIYGGTCLIQPESLSNLSCPTFKKTQNLS